MTIIIYLGVAAAGLGLMAAAFWLKASYAGSVDEKMEWVSLAALYSAIAGVTAVGTAMIVAMPFILFQLVR
ncbi:hypothetical protein [Devosia aurantiaca]|uniref:Uncharacterized protein n=1 Tax=Devosia aurantiaca TaxID=2714858 RepID=A0A6M1SP59_9HYPH|nr:hypothetical protein [Devosia aurantiaca]NGP18910.1 hypothetical protein [Devosia aurantiaca]